MASSSVVARVSRDSELARPIAQTLVKSPILAQFGEVYGGVDWDLRPLAYGRLSIGEGPASDGLVKRFKRRDAATAIGDDDRTPPGGVTNPAPRLEVQFADRDRLHAQIVMHFLYPSDSVLCPLFP